MVLYFSATGNTEFIAKRIANGLNDESLNLLKPNDLHFSLIPEISNQCLHLP